MEKKYYLYGLCELNKMYKEIDAIYHNLSVRFGISDTSFWILYILSESDQGITQYNLCTDWNYSKQTVNSAITLLEKKGYISKVETFDARNRKIIILTKRGEDFVKETVESVKAAELKAFMGLTKEGCAELLHLTDKYLQLFRKETIN